MIEIITTPLFTVLTTSLAIWFSHTSLKRQMEADRENIITQFSLNKNHQDAKEILGYLMEILRELNTLEEVFLRKAQHIPSLEHRMPMFSMKDIESHISIAQRAFQIRSMGIKISENCIKVIALSTKSDLPKIWEICKNLHSFLKGEGEPKVKFTVMINHLMGYLEDEIRPQEAPASSSDKRVDKLCDDYLQKLQEFQIAILHELGEELPYFAKEKGTNLNQLKKKKIQKVVQSEINLPAKDTN